MRTLWTRFKRWYLGGELDPRFHVVGWGPIPLPGEARKQREAHEYAEGVMRMLDEVEKREQQQRDS